MAFDDENDERTFLVLINAEEQYSLWPKYIEVPRGWSLVSEGNKAECLAYVKRMWTDMRPRSLREHTERFERDQRAENP